MRCFLLAWKSLPLQGGWKTRFCRGGNHVKWYAFIFIKPCMQFDRAHLSFDILSHRANRTSRLFRTIRRSHTLRQRCFYQITSKCTYFAREYSYIADSSRFAKLFRLDAFRKSRYGGKQTLQIFSKAMRLEVPHNFEVFIYISILFCLCQA